MHKIEYLILTFLVWPKIESVVKGRLGYVKKGLTHLKLGYQLGYLANECSFTNINDCKLF